MKQTIYILLMLFLNVNIYGQVTKGIEQKESTTREDLNSSLKVRIALIYLSYDDAVILQWAPSKPSVWLIGTEAGYILEKARILPDGSNGKFNPIGTSPIKPWSVNEWNDAINNSISQNDSAGAEYIGLAYTLLNRKEDSAVDISGFAPAGDIRQIKDEKSRLEMQYGFALICAERNGSAAEGLGLRFIDRNVKKGDEYAYRVILAGKSPVYKIDTGYVKVKVEMYNKKQFIREIVPIENDSNIILKWTANTNLSSYLVERSDDGGRTFHVLTKVPLMTLRHKALSAEDFEGFQDTMIVNYKPYLYRVYGNSSFATKELIGTVTAMGRDRTPPGAPFLPQPKHIELLKVKLSWTMPEPAAKDLAGFIIGRDTSSLGPFKIITKNMLPPSAREFIDETFLAGGINYYVVQAVDTAGNRQSSFPALVALIDSTPPARPQWIRGAMDSTGVVTLIIRSNAERDFMGYRILRANAPEHEFSSIIESFGVDSVDYSKDTVFRDTVSLMTLTKYVYYRATSLDKHYNESKFSDIIVVKRPDIIPPVAPVITDVFVTESTVTLKFVSSSSEDLSYQVVFRKVKGKETWDTLAILKKNESTNVDTTVKQNVMYEYSMIAVDSSGLCSPKSFSVTARPYYTGNLPGVTNVSASYDSTSRIVTIRWNYEKLKGNYYFLIYRSFNKEGLIQYTRFNDTSNNTFTDDQFSRGGGLYEYAVKVCNNLGGESKLSEKAGVSFK
ncbi:MAG: hypothetical protein NTX61_08805 [Bacteroidetes bacterium]|nr:hypothetical protein [Bacteroidota bacterium]